MIAQIAFLGRVTVDNYARAAFEEISGGGTLTQSGNAYTLDLGTVIGGGGPLTLQLGVVNNAIGPADLLSGTLSYGADNASTNSGFTNSTGVGDTAYTNIGSASFSGLGAGQSDPLTVTLNTDVNGGVSETFALDPTDSNSAGYSRALTRETLIISAGQHRARPSAAAALRLFRLVLRLIYGCRDDFGVPAPPRRRTSHAALDLLIGETGLDADSLCTHVTDHRLLSRAGFRSRRLTYASATSWA